MVQQLQSSSTTGITAHAYLVAFGAYAEQIGVTQVFGQAVVAQKTCQHTPQSKLLEAFVGTLAGIEHFQDLSRSEHPLDQDELVARAWGEKGWADYSGVSRTLQQMSQPGVDQLIGGLQAINRNFIQQEMAEAERQEGYVVVDADLSGLPVWKQSKSYPGVAYGHMNDVVRLGYQVGVVSLRSPRYGRLWLSIEHHPGNVTSATQALNLIRAAESALGRVPVRRTDLLGQRITQVEAMGEKLREQVSQRQQAWETAHQVAQQRQAKIQAYQQEVEQIERAYAAKERPERMYSQLAKAHGRLARFHQRWSQALTHLARCEKSLTHAQQQWQAHQHTCQELRQRLEGFTQENATNAHPLRIRLRLDAGFGSYDNLLLLIELGYDIYSKVRSSQTVRYLLAQIPTDYAWTRVGADALLATWPGFELPNFPYPVQVAVARFKDPPHLKHNALVYFGPLPLCEQPQVWYSFYNERQSIEAGIKEHKQVFFLHRIKVRSLPAIVLQEYLILFAANFIRWAIAWMHTLPPPPATFRPHVPSRSIHRAVQVGTHTSALVLTSPAGRLIAFSQLSCFFHQAIWLPLPLPSQRKKVPIFAPFSCFAKWLHKT